MYNRVNDLCDAINRYTTEDDKVYIIESAFYASFGYLHQKGIYATYSPRGSYSDRIKEYYDVNPDNQASVILISKEFIKEKKYNIFPEGTSIGQVIEDNCYIRNEDDKYIVYHLP